MRPAWRSRSSWPSKVWLTDLDGLPRGLKNPAHVGRGQRSLGMNLRMPAVPNRRREHRVPGNISQVHQTRFLIVILCPGCYQESGLTTLLRLPCLRQIKKQGGRFAAVPRSYLA